MAYKYKTWIDVTYILSQCGIDFTDINYEIAMRNWNHYSVYSPRNIKNKSKNLEVDLEVI